MAARAGPPAGRGGRRPPTALGLAAWGVAAAVPLVPGVPFDRLRAGGFGVAATPALWAVSLGRPRAAAGRPVVVAARVRLSSPEAPPPLRTARIPAAEPVAAE